MTTVFTGSWTPEDRAESLYRHLEFEVPEGAPGVLVELHYDKTATAALDVGLSDPNGFRGWSGSARKRVAIGPSRATPGYVRGDVVAGTWAVELGLHRVPPAGLPYEITVSFVDGTEPEAAPPSEDSVSVMRERLPAPVGFEWLAGDLHVHSEHSDGTETVAAVALRAARAGLDFVVVGDFNTVSHFRDVDEAAGRSGIRVIPAQTVAIDTGHALVVGSPDWVDLRIEPAVWAAEVWARGGVISANHPVKADSGWICPLPRPVDLAEIWSGNWDRRHRAPLAWWMAAGESVAPVGGSGWTGQDGSVELASPVTWVLAEGDDVLGALRAGRTAVSASVDGPLLLRDGEDLVALRATGCDLVHWDGRREPIEAEHQRIPGPHPAFLHDDSDRVVALCGAHRPDATRR